MNQSGKKAPMCQRNEGEGNPQKKGGGCISIVDTRKGKEGLRKKTQHNLSKLGGNVLGNY